MKQAEAEGRVSPKEINEAVENALRIFMDDVETRVQARREEYLREMRMGRGEAIHDEWEEEEHPRDEIGRFTFKGAGRTGGNSQEETEKMDYDDPQAGEFTPWMRRTTTKAGRPECLWRKRP